MEKNTKHWFNGWFNQDYLNLYSNRNAQEASEQVEFLIKVLQLKGNEKILDLGCGAGRHTLQFAQKGFSVTGIDLSEVLIEEGKRELQKLGPLQVKFKVADIFHLKDCGIFDVVISLFTSFGYFERDEENEEYFSIVRNHLKSGGKFFLDFLHPHQVLQDLIPHETLTIKGEQVEITKEVIDDRIVKTIVFSNPKRTYQEKIKLYSRKQIEMMLSRHGFKVVDVWNDYKGNPWRPDGDRQLFYCL